MQTPIFPIENLELNGIRLEPLTYAHADDLAAACQDGELWQILVTSVPTPDQVIAYIDTAHAIPDRLAFAVIDMASGQAIGSTSYHDILPHCRRLEIGYTWYAHSYWRSHVNTTCKVLLMQYAFETLNYQTVGWRTDINNHRSQAAIERLGAKKDGVIRGNRVIKDGSISDTVMYSVVASEWADIKAKLLKRF